MRSRIILWIFNSSAQKYFQVYGIHEEEIKCLRGYLSRIDYIKAKHLKLLRQEQSVRPPQAAGLTTRFYMVCGQTTLAVVRPPQALDQISFLYHALSTLYFFMTHSFAYP
jgi:hypothetical protein